MKARICRAELRGFRRVLAISDIHGNLSYLKGLLKKVNFSVSDALIIVGDFTEKGPDSLGTLRYVMKLAQQPNVWVLAGNCDENCLQDLLEPSQLSKMISYMKFRKAHWNSRSLLWDFCREAELETLFETEPAKVQQECRRRYQTEWNFLKELPTALLSEDCVFVHAARPETDEPETWEMDTCLRFDAFHRSEGRRFPKPCIVGHWPVVLYETNRMCANPRFNAKRNIFSIDGGCVLKDDGQLNCLILDYATGCWSFEAYDEFTVAVACTAQAGVPASCQINWDDNRMQLLQSGVEFSLCRHLSTGREVSVPNFTLYKDSQGRLSCTGFTDARLSVLSGDRLSVILQTQQGCLVKRQGITGWYFGKLDFS